MTIQTKHIESLFNEGFSLADLLPYIEYSDEVFVLADGSLGKVWQLMVLEAEGKSEDALMSLASQYENLLNRMPNDQLACQIILTSDRDVDHSVSKYADYKEGSQESIGRLSQGFESRRFTPAA